MDLSLERLELLAAAVARRDAARTLELAQAVGLALAGGPDWSRRQRELIRRAQADQA